MKSEDVKTYQKVAVDYQAWRKDNAEKLPLSDEGLTPPPDGAIWRVIHQEYGWVHIQHITPMQDLWAISVEPQYLTLVSDPNPNADYKWVAKMTELFGRSVEG